MSLKTRIYDLNPGLYYKCFKILTYLRSAPYKKRPSVYIKKVYKKHFGVVLNLEKPRTIYDKINFLNLFRYPSMDLKKYVDKAEAKKIISLCSPDGNKHISKTIAVFDTFNEFKAFFYGENFPKKCVIKLTHTSGIVFFFSDGKMRDKFGKTLSTKNALSCLKNMINYSHYFFAFESPYKNLKGRILVEEYLDFQKDSGLNEYKIFCNYGQPIFMNIVYGRQKEYIGMAREAFTSMNFQLLNASQTLPLLRQDEIVIPSCFEQMLDICKNTTSQFPIVRVDFLVHEDTFYFCEFTFVDCAGLSIYKPNEANDEIGNMFNIE